MTDTVKASLIKLGDKKTPRKPLPAVAPAPAIGASTGFAKPQAKVAPAGASSGIASPLTVTAMAGASSMTLVSTDGFFVLNLPLTVNMTDASSRAVQLKFPA